MTQSGGESEQIDVVETLKHQSVLLAQSLELLNIRSGLTYIDATVGFGGHLRAIAEQLAQVSRASQSGSDSQILQDSQFAHASHASASSAAAGDGGQKVVHQPGTTGSVIGIDRDNRSLESLRKRIGDDKQVRLFHANYTDIRDVAAQAGLSTVSGGIIADLGISSMQIDNPERGFSFQKDGPLDMRMDETQSFSAYDIINEWDEKRLADTIYEYGEERNSRAIARNIVNARPLTTTLELAEVVARSQRRGAGRDRHAHHINPATRTFQALRIAVNDELGGLKTFLDEAIALLAPGARIVVITFHSLEDRMVKQIFRRYAQSCNCPPRQPLCNCNAKSELLIITKKPIIADEKEVLANIRSRSAKLRAGEKIG